MTKNSEMPPRNSRPIRLWSVVRSHDFRPYSAFR
jgi:hypothetical protein